MKVKRYLVQDMNEAMIKIKNELGMDAVILNTRKIKTGGLLKWFRKPVIEVVAAVDEPLVAKPSRSQPVIREKEEPQASITPPVVVNEPQAVDHYRKELDELKQMVTTLMTKMNTPESASISPKESVESIEEAYIDFLKDRDVQESIAKKILEIVQRQINIGERNKETIINAMKVVAREYLGDIKTIDKDPRKGPNVYVFLGPTGVGKTTTLAKIAAKLSIVENKKIGLITADTYRIAAVEQLRTYSEILSIPLDVIYEAKELQNALHKFKDKDYILIDTAGRSHKSKELKSDYDELISQIPNATVFLVMSMTTGFKEMKSIIDSYHFIDDYRLLFTKLDEAVNYGNILNVKVLTGKALSYFTIGQSVPDDIEDADKERIIQYIFEGQH